MYGNLSVHSGSIKMLLILYRIRYSLKRQKFCQAIDDDGYGIQWVEARVFEYEHTNYPHV